MFVSVKRAKTPESIEKRTRLLRKDGETSDGSGQESHERLVGVTR